MDVIHFLVASQKALLNELKEIGSNLSDPDLYAKVKKYVSNFDLSEEIEDRLFSAAVGIEQNEFLGGFRAGCRQGNEQVWSALSSLVDAALRLDLFAINDAYGDLRERAEMLFEQKRILFPVLQAWVGQKTLEKLGFEAVEYYAQHHERLEKVESVQTFAVHTPSPQSFRYSEPLVLAS